MKLLTALLVSLTLSAPALAQQRPQHPFVPFTMDEQSYNEIMGYLGAQQFSVAVPLVNTIGKLEHDAQVRQDEAAKKAAEEAAKAKPAEKKP